MGTKPKEVRRDIEEERRRNSWEKEKEVKEIEGNRKEGRKGKKQSKDERK